MFRSIPEENGIIVACYLILTLFHMLKMLINHDVLNCPPARFEHQIFTVPFLACVVVHLPHEPFLFYQYLSILNIFPLEIMPSLVTPGMPSATAGRAGKGANHPG